MEGVPAHEYELDYLITPELGGSGDRRNLWPERYGARVWNARVKDELEQLLPQLVCRGEVDLGDGAAGHRGQLDCGVPEVLPHRSAGRTRAGAVSSRRRADARLVRHTRGVDRVSSMVTNES